nr:hypothetical protein [Marinicella sp. W31]MDC2876341.1 hypothetical protein [Marinicella sp. W31]
MTAYVHKHNGPNGESNRDGHDENYSWNNGVEGDTDNEGALARRRQDVKALLATLFGSRGTIMLKAGDEGGMTQHGNNNAYCQDNETTWIDWDAMDKELVAYTGELSALRKQFAVFSGTDFFTEDDVTWLRPDGNIMTVEDWEAAGCDSLSIVFSTVERETGEPNQLAMLINRSQVDMVFRLPERDDHGWHNLTGQSRGAVEIALAPRSVSFYAEKLSNAG